MHARDLVLLGLLFLATGVAKAEGTNVLTIRKIKAVSDTVENASLLVAWLKTKPGVQGIQSSSIMLTTLPGKRDVRFLLNGEPQILRVSVGWGGKVINTRHELQRMDEVLAELNAAERLRLENSSSKNNLGSTLP